MRTHYAGGGGVVAEGSLEAHNVSRLNVTLSTADACFARGGGAWGGIAAWLLEHAAGYDAAILNELFALFRSGIPAQLQIFRRRKNLAVLTLGPHLPHLGGVIFGEEKN